MQLHYLEGSTMHLEQLIEISKKTFADAFEKDNDPDDFKAYINFAFDRRKMDKELNSPDITFYLVYAGNELCGYFKLNENGAQTEIKDKAAIELERIYVSREFQGKKIGASMLNEVKRIASLKNKAYLWLGVWEENIGAIKFYEKHGFKKFGTHPYYVGKDKQTDWLMRLDLVS